MKLKNYIHSWDIKHYLGGTAQLMASGTPDAIHEIRKFIQSDKPAITESELQQSRAWQAVASALDQVAPQWRDGDDTAVNLAVAAIKKLAAPAPKPAPEPMPFDLEAAKAGAQLVTRDGRKARFVAHIPEANIGHRFVAFIDGNAGSRSFFESGSYYPAGKDAMDLFMAPKPKKTVWVNLYQGGFNEWQTYNTAEDAEAAASRDNLPIIARAIAVAVPIEINA